LLLLRFAPVLILIIVIGFIVDSVGLEKMYDIDARVREAINKGSLGRMRDLLMDGGDANSQDRVHQFTFSISPVSVGWVHPTIIFIGQ